MAAGLFPRAWTVYEEPDPQLRVVCQQISPVIPDNYRETRYESDSRAWSAETPDTAGSFPVGVFVYTLENRDSVAKSVSLLLSFQNGTGGAGDLGGGCVDRV